MEICEFDKLKDSFLLLSKSFPKIHLSNFSSVSFPTSSLIYSNGRSMDCPIYFSSFEDRVEIFSSLQKPKKVIVHCSDGTSRAILCKPNDDLRKDLRFLELAVLVNDLLSKKKRPDSCKIEFEFFSLSIGISVYAVVPLNENCGIIEWMEHTLSLRSILLTQYRDLGMTINHSEFVELQKQANFVNYFANTILPQYL